MESYKQHVEMSLLKEDTLFYWDLGNELKGSKSNPIFILGFFPYFSLYVVESYTYLSGIVPDAAELLERKHFEIIKKSRHTTKLLDGKKESFEGIINFHKEIGVSHFKAFVDENASLLGYLRRLFQKDLGLFTYANRIICTSHTAQINLGFEDVQVVDIIDGEGIRSLSTSVGYQIGEYIGTMVRVFNQESPSETFGYSQYKLDDKLVSFRDVRAIKYYGSIFGEAVAKEIGATLVYLLVAISFVDQVLQGLVVSKSNTFFKQKFITLYHFAGGIERLQNFSYQKSYFSKQIKDLFAEIFSDNELKQIKTKRRLRNILVHYGLEDFPEESLDDSLQMYGLVEHYFKGAPFQTIDDLLDRQIRRLSDLARELLN